MRERANDLTSRLNSLPIELNSDVWRARLYSAGSIFARSYTVSNMPSEQELYSDLEEALKLYRKILNEGRWAAVDETIELLNNETGHEGLIQAKSYALHRRIERKSSHSKKVIGIQGTKCRGCDTDLAKVYGVIGSGIIDAHHLRPLGALAENEVVSFDQ